MGSSLSKHSSATVQRFKPGKDKPTFATKELSKGETEYLEKRHVTVKKAIQEMTGIELNEESGVPIISIAFGGRGGARSLPLILGVMQELELRDFLKTVSYTATSGVASCFLVLWHALQAKDMMALEDAIRELACNRWLLEDISKRDLKRIAFELKKLDRMQMPLTLLDVYSVLLSWRVFGCTKKRIPLDLRLSGFNEQKLMRKHLTPYPLIDVLAVQKGIPEEIHSNHFEFAPILSGFRSAQCFVDTRVFGMKIEKGELVGGRRNFYVDVDGYKHACRQQESLGHILGISMSSFNDSRWSSSLAPSLLPLKKLKKTKRMKHILNHLNEMDMQRRGVVRHKGYDAPLTDSAASRYHKPVLEPTLSTRVLGMDAPTPGSPVAESPVPASPTTGGIDALLTSSPSATSQSLKKVDSMSAKVEFIRDQIKSYNFSAHLWDVKENTNDGRNPSLSTSKEYTPRPLSTRRYLYFKEPTESLSIPIAPLVRSERVPRILVILEFSGSHDMIELKKAMAYAALNDRPFPTIDLSARNFKKPVQIFEPQPHDPPNSPFVVYFQLKTNSVFDKKFDPSSIQENLVTEEEFQQLMLWARFTAKEFFSKLVRLMKRGTAAQAPTMLAGGSFAESEGPLFQRTNSVAASIYSTAGSDVPSVNTSMRLDRRPSMNQVHSLSSRKPSSVAAHQNSTRNLDRDAMKHAAQLRRMNTQKQLLNGTGTLERKSTSRSSKRRIVRSDSRRIQVAAS